MERAKKRQRQEDESTTPASTRNPEIFLRLQNISSAGLQQINEVIEAVISKEQEKHRRDSQQAADFSAACLERGADQRTRILAPPRQHDRHVVVRRLRALPHVEIACSVAQVWSGDRYPS